MNAAGSEADHGDQRPEPARLELAAYPYRLQMATRFSDLDIRGHINNVAVMRYTEDVRVAFQAETIGPEIYQSDSRARVVVAQLTIQFVAEAFFPAPIDAGIGVIRIGNSSYVLGCGLFQEGRCVAVQDATLVYRAAQGALSLPAEVRARMERYRL